MPTRVELAAHAWRRLLVADLPERVTIADIATVVDRARNTVWQWLGCHAKPGEKTTPSRGLPYLTWPADDIRQAVRDTYGEDVP